MSSLYSQILEKRDKGEQMLAILIDPDKFDPAGAALFLDQLQVDPDIFLVGGSEVADRQTGKVVSSIKALSNKPIVIFPGDVNQLTPEADAILFLSLLSGDNPEYLISQQVRAAGILREGEVEVIPVGYILVDNRNDSAVSRVTRTEHLDTNDIETIVNTAFAGQLMGKQLIYLEAGSGATFPVATGVIQAVSAQLSIPLIVGGGIRTASQLEDAYRAGADMVVMGNVFEKTT